MFGLTLNIFKTFSLFFITVLYPISIISSIPSNFKGENCSSEGLPPEVLHILMGHSDFDTTRKYYIHITDARKQQEALKLYNKQYSEEELQALFERNKMYLEKISVLV